MYKKLNLPNFEFRRRIDDITSYFHPCESIDGHPAWKREDFNLWVTQTEGFGWACIDSEKCICGIPWGIAFDKMDELPPEGEWVSKKGDKAYVYDLCYK